MINPSLALPRGKNASLQQSNLMATKHRRQSLLPSRPPQVNQASPPIRSGTSPTVSSTNCAAARHRSPKRAARDNYTFLADKRTHRTFRRPMIHVQHRDSTFVFLVCVCAGKETPFCSSTFSSSSMSASFIVNTSSRPCERDENN